MHACLSLSSLSSLDNLPWPSFRCSFVDSHIFASPLSFCFLQKVRTNSLRRREVRDICGTTACAGTLCWRNAAGTQSPALGLAHASFLSCSSD
ncbi:MAG: hypothetical protein ACPIOQ_33930, partial [Promethearchaeia archaeon]